MADNIVQGLFGLSPYDVQQARLQDANTQALQYAKLDPFQKANMSLYQAGGGLGRMGAGMLGMVDPKEQEAQIAEMGQAQIDHSTPEGLLKGAEMFNQVGNPKMAMMYAQAAQAMKANQSKLELEAAQAHKAMVQADEEPKMRMEIARGNLDARLAQIAQQAEIAKQRSEDTRFSIEERNKSAEQARALQLQIAQMMDETKRFGIQSASDLKAEKENDKKTAIQEKKNEQYQSSIDALDNFILTIDQLIDENGNPKKGFNDAFGQFDAMYPNIIKFDDTSTAYKTLESLRHQETMANLSKAKSQVGQSFGSLQIQEWPKFTNLRTSLDPDQPQNSLRNNLIDLRKKSIKMRDDVKSKIGVNTNIDTTNNKEENTKSVPSLKDLINKHTNTKNGG